MRKSVQVILTVFCLISLIPACAPVTPAPTPTTTPTPTTVPSPTQPVQATPTQSLDPQQYLTDAMDIIEQNALNSKNLDWTEVRAAALLREKDAKTPQDTYDTITEILKQLQDHHSFFLTPDQNNQLENSTVADYLQPQGKLIGNIGYVAVYAFGAQSQEEVDKYADEIQNILLDLNRQSVCGWIVDLSENGGGNMYPMIAGLGALIGEGELGSFKDADGQISKWYYRDGQSWGEDVPLAKVSQPDFLLDPENAPVAVLIGPRTASSGEATAISFRGRPNTRFFGQPSYGLTTGNSIFTLQDGAAIVLTGVIELDRTGQEYGGKIVPDVETFNAKSDAITWLLNQPACQK